MYVCDEFRGWVYRGCDIHTLSARFSACSVCVCVCSHVIVCTSVCVCGRWNECNTYYWHWPHLFRELAQNDKIMVRVFGLAFGFQSR